MSWSVWSVCMLMCMYISHRGKHIRLAFEKKKKYSDGQRTSQCYRGSKTGTRGATKSARIICTHHLLLFISKWWSWCFVVRYGLFYINQVSFSFITWLCKALGLYFFSNFKWISQKTVWSSIRVTVQCWVSPVFVDYYWAAICRKCLVHFDFYYRYAFNI